MAAESGRSAEQAGTGGGARPDGERAEVEHPDESTDPEAAHPTSEFPNTAQPNSAHPGAHSGGTAVGSPGTAPRVHAGFTSGFDPEVVRAWIADDPDPAARTELGDLLRTALEEPGEASAAALSELSDRFSGPLEFGTAGLRGEVAAGPHRMNRAVVIRAAAGLSAFLQEHTQDGSAAPFSVVIGCDARRGSADFAHDTAAVVTAAGGRALLLPPQLPTPLTAFAVQHLSADAGVMVTASHNPPRDNGYKVYLGARPLRALGGDAEAAAGAGAQIVPPADALIAARIAAVPSVGQTPRTDPASADPAVLERWVQLDETIVESYLESVAGLGVRAHPSGPLRIVTTALHGVGASTLARALDRAGFSDVHPTLSQAEPDPDFPTVAFPNPEEDGALDEVVAVAERVGADLIIANDPDADRFSAAIPSPDGSGWYQLSGDEVGLLLGEAAALRLSRGPDPSREPGTGASASTGSEAGVRARQTANAEQTAGTGQNTGQETAAGPVIANSIVSSRGLAAVAAHHGLTHRNSLTGFKWISRVPGLAYGYEEALGYCVDPAHVRDKDGISAALLFAARASQLRAGGSSIAAELRRIRARDGVFRTRPLTFRLEDTSLIAAGMTALRAAPPAELGGSPVVTVADLVHGWEDLAPTDGMLLLSAAGDRVIVRPSGTEPKLKCYLEAVEPVTGGTSGVDAAWESAGHRLTGITGELRAFFRL
ncbi:phospho-sugar mutase [Brevibacterium album]|uniref:phospho-sugar mutase n=1 Tax=Brevibacterium album TaxID=417948 RepID=UPI00041234BC|nr:phospho-sugar mutase [Brevibacterium album]